MEEGALLLQLFLIPRGENVDGNMINHG